MDVSERTPITFEQIAANLGLIQAHIDKHPDVAERMCGTLREWSSAPPPTGGPQTTTSRPRSSGD